MSVLVMIEIQSSSCASVITNGGANRMMLPCVGFARSPFSIVLSVRGRGLLNAIVINDSEESKTAWNICLKLMENGLTFFRIIDHNGV